MSFVVLDKTGVHPDAVYRVSHSGRTDVEYFATATRSLSVGEQVDSGLALHSSIFLDDPDGMILMPYLHSVTYGFLATEQESVLTLGLGAGSLPRFINHHFPATVQTVVEKSPAMYSAYRKRFPKRFGHFFIADARQYIAKVRGAAHFDFILVDTFPFDVSEDIEASMWSRDALHDLHSLLTPHGIVALNFKDSVPAAQFRAAGFKTVLRVSSPTDWGEPNQVLLLSNDPHLTEARFRASVSRYQECEGGMRVLLNRLSLFHVTEDFS